MSKKFILMVMLIGTITLNSQTLKDEWVICKSQGCKILDPYYSEGVTVIWEGNCLNGKANGNGKLTKYYNSEIESIYEGDYKNGIREGKGKFTHLGANSVLECTFINGQAIGNGTYELEGGHKYVGEIVNYRRHGQGIFYFANGAKFEGFSVSDNLYTGKFTNYDGTVTYIQKGSPVKTLSENKINYKPQLGVRVTEYFNENWKRCNQNDASFYRLVTYKSDNKPEGIVKDYYITGELQSEFYAIFLDYDDEGKNFHEGEAKWYYKNGKIERKYFYYNNKINGKYIEYYDNGIKALEANYIHGSLNGDYKQWYKTGKLNLFATYTNDELLNNKYIEYDENGAGAYVFNENFNANKHEWSSIETGSESIVNELNQVQLIMKENKSTVRGNYITFNQNSDFSIESIIQQKYGKNNIGHGIFFGFKDWDNYFQFIIAGNGQYRIDQVVEGINISIADWTATNSVNKGNERNLLKVLKLGERFIFTINGNVVENVDYKILRGNYFGIFAGGKGEYILENIILKEFLADTDDTLKSEPSKENETDNWKGNGSGFFIHEKGYIATNYHVIEEAKEIQIEYFQKGIKQIFKAKVIVSDKQNDLAILKIDDVNFKILPKIPYVFNTSIKDVGTEVFTLGYPIAHVMGEEIKFTDGKISSKTGLQGDVRVYQISAPIQPGNSGGPLFDTKGNLVGINSSTLNREHFNSENVNYAIKTTYLKSLIDVLPETINVPDDLEIYNKTLTDKIKVISDFIPIIKVR